MDLSSYVPQKQYRYYFERCDAMEQKVYDALLDGYLKQKKEIRVWVANSDSLWKIHQAICYDVLCEKSAGVYESRTWHYNSLSRVQV